MIKPENTGNVTLVTNQPCKKNWSQPELVLIGSATINAKSHPNVKESTGAPFTNPTGKQYVTDNASYSFQGTINQAAS